MKNNVYTIIDKNDKRTVEHMLKSTFLLIQQYPLVNGPRSERPCILRKKNKFKSKSKNQYKRSIVID